MEKLIRYFANHTFAVNLVSVFIILSGLILGSMIKRDTKPPFEFKSIVARMKLPGASATEVEKYLAYPMEKVLRGLPHANEITTESESGSLKITIYFNVSYGKINESVEEVRSRIDSISWQLPEQIRNISVKQDKLESVFHLGIALENFDETDTHHRFLAKGLADKIRSVPGILNTSVQMHDRNLYIKFKPDKIAEYEISIAEVREKIRQALNFAPIGAIEFDERFLTIEVQRPAETIKKLKRLAVRGNLSGAPPVYLENLAEIVMEIDEIKEKHRFNGRPTIKLFTRKDIYSDAISLKKQIQVLLDQTNREFPKGLKATIFIDTPKFIEKQLDVLTKNGLFGLLFVLIILSLFFNWKVALVTSFGIPIAYCATLIILYFCNISIDLVSVVGMIMVIGLLVDDAIIITERYLENLEKGQKPEQASVRAGRDLILPVTGTVLTTVFSFAPMAFIKSEASIVFFAIPLVVIASLAMSWLESFFILPNHLQHFIKEAPKKKSGRDLFLKIRMFYKKILSKTLRFRYLTLLFLLVIFAFSCWIALNKIQQNFSFHPSRERIAIKVRVKENKSLTYTEQVIVPIENYLLTLPKDVFSTVSINIGQMWDRGRNYRGYRYAKLYLHINDDIVRPQKIKRHWTEKLKQKMKEFENKKIESIQVGRELKDQEEEKKNIVTLDISGKEDVDYLALKARIQEEIDKHNMGLELVREVNEFDEKWIFIPDTRQLSQHRINLSGLTRQLRSFFVPHELMQIRIRGETKWIYTQVKRSGNLKESELNNLSVINNTGLTVPMKELGRWEQKKQLARIRHKDGKRLFEFDLAFEPSGDMNLNTAKKQGRQISQTLSQIYPTYQIQFRDGDRAETKSRLWAMKVALVCVLLVLLTLALVLGSLTLPLILGLPIPFGLTGVIWALYLHDMPMGIMSLIGLVGTVGVSVNDSLIMVDTIMKKKKQGLMTRDHIIEGASSRLRAIILTTSTTLAGVFPMAYGIGGESGFTQPLAFSLGWGLFFATFLTLFILPACLEIRRDFQRWVQKMLI